MRERVQPEATGMSIVTKPRANKEYGDNAQGAGDMPAAAKVRNRRRAQGTGKGRTAGGSIPTDRAPRPMAVDLMALGPSLTIQEASGLKQQLGGILSAGGAVHLDGAGVRSADTAGIQLLVAFSREAKLRNLEIIWRGASEVLLRSAARLGLSTLLGLAAPNEAP
jgi:phospholipid transport system transporter-binding protein